MRRIYALFAILVMIAFCPCLQAGSSVVWQIGKFDESSAEFNQSAVRPPAAAELKADVLYTIGKSNPALDWPAFQPGSANGKAEFRPHPYAIKFDLPQAPQGVFTLKVSLLVESPRVARLQVEINGHRALLFQKPLLNYAAGDVTSVFLPMYAADTLAVDVPTSFLKRGTNELVLTAIDEPAERDNVTNSGLTYDALELDQDTGRTFAYAAASVEAQPTIFYQRNQDKLLELVNVYIHHNSPSNAGQASLLVGRQKFTARLSAGS